MSTPTVPPNPYDYINPVQDPKMFAGRQDELLAIAEEVRRLKGVHVTSPVVAIVGARRVGKTSLLQRVEEKCSSEGLLPVLMTITDTTASHPREFWRDLFDSILRSGTNVGVFERPGDINDFGFLRSGNRASTALQKLQFANFYLNNLPIPMQVLQDDLLTLMKSVIDSNLGGVMLLVDEAHLLTECREISQQIRAVVREIPKCGIVFAGEPRLGSMFTDESQPLFGQARMIHLGNFQSSNDVALSVLVPLTEDQRVLVSPMTIDYLSRLSQGKPNQIRLVCNSVYRRYERGQQADLNITIEALDEVLESIESSYALDYDLRAQVQRIQRLSSVDLEIPIWHDSLSPVE